MPGSISRRGPAGPGERGLVACRRQREEAGEGLGEDAGVAVAAKNAEAHEEREIGTAGGGERAKAARAGDGLGTGVSLVRSANAREAGRAGDDVVTPVSERGAVPGKRLVGVL
jgi:hypothetical protein